GFQFLYRPAQHVVAVRPAVRLLVAAVADPGGASRKARLEALARSRSGARRRRRLSDETLRPAHALLSASLFLDPGPATPSLRFPRGDDPRPAAVDCLDAVTPVECRRSGFALLHKLRRILFLRPLVERPAAHY